MTAVAMIVSVIAMTTINECQYCGRTKRRDDETLCGRCLGQGEITRLRREAVELRKALRFYADERNWVYAMVGPGAKAADNGNVARYALALTKTNPE